jgi:hypothetical protein
MVRAYNSSAEHGDFRLLKMNLRGAGPHPDFPNTRTDLEHIQHKSGVNEHFMFVFCFDNRTGCKINTLLEAYGFAVPADAELQDQRVLFGQFIGVTL